MLRTVHGSVWHRRSMLPVALLAIVVIAHMASSRTAVSQQLQASIPLRYLAINVGNASPQYGCWEYKLCRAQDVQNLRNYIAAWKPDIIMLSEVYRKDQLTGTAMNGPILPPGYTGICGESRDRMTGALVAWNASNASHEHECIAWKTSRVSYVSGSALSAYGRNDSYGKANCSYDFTGFRARLLLAGQATITAVAVHPNSSDTSCRVEEINRYWGTLAAGTRVIIGGDWNTDVDSEIQRPAGFKINYSRGQHWNLVTHSGEYSAIYSGGLVKRHLDHAYSNFGSPCTTCGGTYGTVSLPYGSVLGGYDGHPRADNGEGMDHRQILVDMLVATS
ncbi:MAG TPA: endonuclease/exonuclease/phosphatase family protein [Herpetosiphonaceae bacterium]